MEIWRACMRVCLCNLDCMRSNFASLSYSRSAACSLRHQNSLRLDVEPMAWMGRGAELIAGGFRSVQSRSGPSRQRSPAVRTLAISKPSVLISPTCSAKLTDLPPYEHYEHSSFCPSCARWRFLLSRRLQTSGEVVRRIEPRRVCPHACLHAWRDARGGRY